MSTCGEPLAEAAFHRFTRERNRRFDDASPADADIVSDVERQLAGAIGASSARIMVASVLREEMHDIDEVMQILDEASELIVYSRRLEEKSRELEAARNEIARLDNLARLQERIASFRVVESAPLDPEHERARNAEVRRLLGGWRDEAPPPPVEGFELFGRALALYRDAGDRPSAMVVLINLANLTVKGSSTSVLNVHSEGTANLAGVSFVGNTSQAGGGAISNQGTLRVAGSNFTGNKTNNANGGAIVSSGDLQIAGSVFNGNISQFSGGAIAISGGEAEIDDTIFNGNIANGDAGYGGGAIALPRAPSAEPALDRQAFAAVREAHPDALGDARQAA